MKNVIQKLFSRRNLTIVLLTFVGFFGFLFALNYGLEKYNQSKQWQEIKKSAEAFQKAEQELYQKMMADTYGGKTPQETLELFIAAVEKGDYELASKYFVSEKQEEWNKNFAIIRNMDEYIKDTKEIRNSLKTGRFSDEKDWFSIEKPVHTIFILYPNGIWKIKQI